MKKVGQWIEKHLFKNEDTCSIFIDFKNKNALTMVINSNGEKQVTTIPSDKGYYHYARLEMEKQVKLKIAEGFSLKGDEQLLYDNNFLLKYYSSDEICKLSPSLGDNCNGDYIYTYEGDLILPSLNLINKYNTNKLYIKGNITVEKCVYTNTFLFINGSLTCKTLYTLDYAWVDISGDIFGNIDCDGEEDNLLVGGEIHGEIITSPQMMW